MRQGILSWTFYAGCLVSTILKSCIKSANHHTHITLCFSITCQYNISEQLTSFSIGIARVTGNRYQGSGGFLSGGKRVDIIPTIGFVSESQLFLKIGSSFGLGLNLYFNLNKEESFGGIAINIVFGALRKGIDQ